MVRAAPAWEKTALVFTSALLVCAMPLLAGAPELEISDFGAHNQRARVEIEVRMGKLVWIEELVSIAESSGSAPVRTLLKREDEKALTEQAFSNPRFVEDVVREISLALDSDNRIGWYRVSVTSEESIHDHQAFASLERGTGSR